MRESIDGLASQERGVSSRNMSTALGADPIYEYKLDSHDALTNWMEGVGRR